MTVLCSESAPIRFSTIIAAIKMINGQVTFAERVCLKNFETIPYPDAIRSNITLGSALYVVYEEEQIVRPKKCAVGYSMFLFNKKSKNGNTGTAIKFHTFVLQSRPIAV